MTNTTATRVRALLESGTLSPLLPIPPELYEGDWSSDAIIALVTSFAAVPVGVSDSGYMGSDGEVMEEIDDYYDGPEAFDPADGTVR
jgi:hypothetical protein